MVLGALNLPSFNQRLGVLETGGRNDAQAKVNQFGIVDHGQSLVNNGMALFEDASMFLGPAGTVVNGGKALWELGHGNFGNAIGSATKAAVSLIPGLAQLVGGVSFLKNSADVGLHAFGAVEQTFKGGYEAQTRQAQRMFGGNMGMGLSLYGAPANTFGWPRV
jgi:hypothetical protein